MTKKPAKRRYPCIEPMGDGWRATVRIAATLHKGKTRRTQKEAHEDAKALQNLRDEGNADGANATLADAMQQVRNQCALKRNRPATLVWYEEQFALLTKSFGAGQKLRLLTKARVQEFVNQRLMDKVGPRTIRHNVQALRRLFRVSDLMPPLLNLVLPKLDDEDPDVFEWQDALRILERVRKVDEFEWAVFTLFLYTGVRRAEAARIRIIDDETDIDWGQKLLRVKIGKRRPRTLPVPDGLLDVLAVLVDAEKRPTFDDGGGDGLLPGADEAKRTGYVRRVFERWANRLKEPRLHPHTMRHTFASRLASLGVSESTVEKLRGHRGAPRSITARYIHAHGPELRAAMARLWE